VDVIFDPRLVLYLPLYLLDGGSFMSRDACGHLCAVTGALWRPDGRYFDGNDDWINCGDIQAAFDGANDQLTIIAWVKLADTDDNHTIAAKYQDNARTFLVRVNSGGTVRAACYKDGATPNYALSDTDSAVISGGNWYCLAATMNLASQNIRIFLDGDEQPSTQTVVGTPPAVFDDTSQVVEVGSMKSGSANPYKGLIGEVLLSGRVYTLAEIQSYYLKTKWRYS